MASIFEEIVNNSDLWMAAEDREVFDRDLEAMSLEEFEDLVAKALEEFEDLVAKAIDQRNLFASLSKTPPNP